MTSIHPERPAARASSVPPAVSDARARARLLRAEAEATSERTAKSALLYEAGYVHELLLQLPAQAVQDYLASYNTDNRSRLPLHALVRMFERRRSYKNLARLYDAAVRSARSAAERGSALVDQATLSLLTGGDAYTVQARLKQALEHEPKSEAALLLEWHQRASGQLEGAVQALTKRAESSDDPVHRGALLLELARLREARGELSGALEALRAAALAAEPAAEVYTIALARFAQEHGFAHELVEANERRAQLLVTELTASERAAKDAQLIDSLRARAIALWYEAARLRCARLSDPLGALRSLDGARALAPADPLLRLLRLHAYDLLEDRERAAEEARALLEAGLSGAQSAALQFRLAEHALVIGDAEAARAKLLETIELSGGSAAAEAMLDDLLLDEGRHGERIAQRVAIAARSEPELARRELGEAAQIAAQELRDGERALALFTRLDALAPGDGELLREAYGCALDLGYDPLARFALGRLSTLELAQDERAALLLHRFELAEPDERAELIDRELARPERAAALLQLALLHAAERRDYAHLAQAHEARAALSAEREDTAAELCAGARAWVRARDLPRARGLLERALEREPSQRYALTLLEEVLREQGDAAAAIELLRAAAERHQDARDAELHLLAAGIAAEHADDIERAVQNYRRAADKPEPSLGALWALQRLAHRRGARDLERVAREGLSARERGQERAGVDTMLLAEHYDLVDQQPAQAEPLWRRALEDADLGHHAAISLAIARGAPLELRGLALELLATRATDSLRPALLRELGGQLVAHGGPQVRVLDLLERVRRARPQDRWAAWTRTHTGLAHDDAGHAAALEAFAETTTDTKIADVARAEALWARQLSAPERPLDETLANQLPRPDELSPELAETVIALASPVHDSGLRARALETLARASEPETRAALLLSLARARLAQDDAAGALTALQELLAAEPAPLAAWELAYTAARKAGRAGLWADAAEHLAEQLDGEQAIELFEESAVVRMDELDDKEGAERVFVHVLGMAPRRTHAYARLHELLEQRGSLVKLLSLVRRRARTIDDPEELVRLYYEVARLERNRGELALALDAVDNVLMLDDEHVGALALRAEIQTSRGNFREAVEALDRLSTASSLPKAQRRLAGLGAADFLEHKLGDGAAALERLERLIALEASDPKLHVRVADLAERLGNASAGEPNDVGARGSAGEPNDVGAQAEARAQHHERAAAALARAVELVPAGAEQIALAMRHAELLSSRLAQRERAAAVYRQVLERAPDHVEAARALWAMDADPQVLVRVERAVRAQASERPRDPEPLRKLSAVAELKGDRDLTFGALGALDALDALDEREHAFWERAQAAARARRITPGAELPEEELRELLTPSLEPAVQQVLHAVFMHAGELCQLEPGRFGVGRGQRLARREPHPLRDELAALARVLGILLGDVYVGGDEPKRIVALPREDGLGLVLGTELRSPLQGADLYAAALQLAAVRLETVPLLGRSAASAAQLVFAALAAEGAALPPGILREALGELPRIVARALPRKTRRALPQLVRALPGAGAELEASCQIALAHTRRLALLLSGELAAALREVGFSQDGALDLLRAWTSSAMSSSRRKLGLAP